MEQHKKDSIENKQKLIEILNSIKIMEENIKELEERNIKLENDFKTSEKNVLHTLALFSQRQDNLNHIFNIQCSISEEFIKYNTCPGSDSIYNFNKITDKPLRTHNNRRIDDLENELKDFINNDSCSLESLFETFSLDI